MHVEVVTNIIPTMNDDEEQLRNIATWIRDNLGELTPWHVTRFHPLHEFTHLSATPVSTLERAYKIGKEAGLKFVYLGNVPGHEGCHTYCHNCRKILIERRGYLIPQFNLEKGRCKFCGTAIPGRWT